MKKIELPTYSAIGRSCKGENSILNFFINPDNIDLIMKDDHVCYGWKEKDSDQVWVVTASGYKKYPKSDLNPHDGTITDTTGTFEILPFAEKKEPYIHFPTFLIDTETLKLPADTEASRYSGKYKNERPSALTEQQRQLYQNNLHLHDGRPEADFERSLVSGNLRVTGATNPREVNPDENVTYEAYLNRLLAEEKISEEQKAQLMKSGNTFQSMVYGREWMLENLSLDWPQKTKQTVKINVEEDLLTIQYILELSELVTQGGDLKSIVLNDDKLNLIDFMSEEEKIENSMGTIINSRTFYRNGNVSGTHFELKDCADSFYQLITLSLDPISNYQKIINCFHRKDEALAYIHSLSDKKPLLTWVQPFAQNNYPVYFTDQRLKSALLSDDTWPRHLSPEEQTILLDTIIEEYHQQFTFFYGIVASIMSFICSILDGLFNYEPPVIPQVTPPPSPRRSTSTSSEGLNAGIGLQQRPVPPSTTLNSPESNPESKKDR